MERNKEQDFLKLRQSMLGKYAPREKSGNASAKDDFHALRESMLSIYTGEKAQRRQQEMAAFQERISKLEQQRQKAKPFFSQWRSGEEIASFREGFEEAALREEIQRLKDTYSEFDMRSLTPVSQALDKAMQGIQSYSDYYGQFDSEESYADYLRRSELWMNQDNHLEEARGQLAVKEATDGLTEKERKQQLRKLDGQISGIQQQMAAMGRAADTAAGQSAIATAQKQLEELRQQRRNLELGGEHSGYDELNHQIQDSREQVSQAMAPFHGVDARGLAGADGAAMERYAQGMQDYQDTGKKLNAQEQEKARLDKVEKYDGKTYKDTFWGQSKANYSLGRLSQDSSLAWNKYLNNPTEENRRDAETIDQLITQFQQGNEETLADDGTIPLLSKTLANYLPQFFDQAGYSIAGGSLGMMTGNPYMVKAGIIAGSGAYSYETMRGAAFKALLEAGVDEDTARQAANDEALVSSLIEMGDTALDLITLGGGKAIDLLTKGSLTGLEKQLAKFAGKNTLTKLAAAAGKYGLNVLSEGAQEGIQEAVSIANIQREDTGKWNLAGEAGKVLWDALRNGDDPNREQIFEAGKEGMKLAAVLGGAEAGYHAMLNQYLGKVNAAPEVGEPLEVAEVTAENGVAVPERAVEEAQPDISGERGEATQVQLDSSEGGVTPTVEVEGGINTAKGIELEEKAAVDGKAVQETAEAAKEAELDRAEKVPAGGRPGAQKASDGEPEGRKGGTAAVRVSTGEAVEIQSIQATDGQGGMTFRLSDGTEAENADIQQENEGEAILYESVAALGVNASTANTLVEGWKHGPEEIGAEAYAAGMMEAFNYGRYHIPQGEMARNEAVQALTEAQQNTAYALGKAFGGELVQTREANARRARMIQKAQKAAKNAAEAKAMAASVREKPSDAKTGKVVFDRKGRTLNEAQETGLKTMEQISQLFGVEFHVFESYEKDGKRVFRAENGEERAAPNGWYEADTNRIYIDLNAGSAGQGTMLFTVAHELSHFIREWSPAKFDKLAEAVFALGYQEQGISVVELVRGQQDKALRNGRNLDFDSAYEEVVADSMEGILTSGRGLEMMAKLKQEDKSLWEKVKQWFQDLAEDIRKLVKAYAGVKPDSAEGRAVAKMETMLPILEGFYVDALQEAGENYQAAGNMKNTTDEGGKKFSFVGRNTDGIEVYETSDEVKSLPWKERKKMFLRAMRTQFRGRTAKFVRNGHAYYAKFSYDDVNKNIYGDENSDDIGRDAKINIGADGNIFELIENSKYLSSEGERGKEGKTHRGVNYWDYFVKTVQIDGRVFDCIANVRKKDDGEYVYVIELHEDKEIEPSLPDEAPYGVLNGAPNSSISNLSIQDSQEKVNKKLSLRNTSQMPLEEQLKKYYRDELKTSDSLYFGETPETILASGLEPLPLAFPTANFKKSTQEKHNVPRRVVKGLRNSLEHALFSFGKEGRFGFVVPEIDGDGKPLLIGIQAGVEMDRQKVNVIRSVYGLDHPEAWIQNQIQAGKEFAVYDKKRADSWLRTYSYSALLGGGIELFDSNITREGGEVNEKRADPQLQTYGYLASVGEGIELFDSNLAQDQEKVNKKFSDRDPLQEEVMGALKQENDQLREDVKRLKEWNKLQRKHADGKLFRRSDVEAEARNLKKMFDVKNNADPKELADLLSGLYEYMADITGPIQWENIVEEAKPIVAWLEEHKRFRRGEHSQSILDALKGRTFYLDEVQTQEVRRQFGNLRDYRHLVKNMASSKAVTSLDQLWQEMASQFPDAFGEDVNAADMPGAFAEILERLDTRETVMDMDMQEQEMIREVYDSYWKATTLETMADKRRKMENSYKKVLGEHKNTIEGLKKDLDNLQKKKTAAVKGVRDTRNKAEMRRRIRRKIMDLQKLLLRGNKKRNIKEGMREFVATALATADILFTDNYSNEDMVRNGVGVEVTAEESRLLDETEKLLNMRKDIYNQWLIGSEIEEVLAGDTAKYEERMKQARKLSRDISQNMGKLKDVFQRERNRLNKATVSGILGDLAKAYRELGNSEEEYIRFAMDENVYQHLLQLQTDVGGTIVKDMSLKQLKELADAYTMVLTTVRNANKMFSQSLNISREAAARQVVQEVQGKGSKLVLPGKDMASTFGWNNTKPVYAFERLGSEVLKNCYQGIRDGQDVYAVDIQEAHKFIQEQGEKYEAKTWDREKQQQFHLGSGDVALNLGERMSIYALSRREEGRNHLLGEGFVFSRDTEVVVKKNGIPLTYRKADATAYRLTLEEIQTITDTLTPEQKAYARQMQGYLAEVMGAKGNEVSMKLYGIKSFQDENYFPIRSAGQYMERAKEQQLRQEQGQVNLVNAGFTKSTVPNAKNPLVLTDFSQVWADHVEQMSLYHGLALPLEDFRKVYNYKVPMPAGEKAVSVNAAIENAFGKGATGYLDQLIRDVNGGLNPDNRETLGKRMVGQFKKAAVAASLSVVIQQFSALPRAFALIDPQYFLGKKLDKKKHRALWAEIKQYAPVAFIKEMGYFDTGMGQSAKEYLLSQKPEGIVEKMKALVSLKDGSYREELIGKLPALADEATWCQIWEAVKRETKAKNPKLDVYGEEFLKKAGKRFSEVIDKTQVYDSVLSRSANMRSKTTFMNIATSFMAEPTTTINMMEDALRSKDPKKAARVLASVLASQTMNALLASLVYAARDDEEDKTWAEKYLSTVAVEMVEGLNPITYYPFLKDMWSVFQGYSVERADMTLVSDLANGVNRWNSARDRLSRAETQEEMAKAEEAYREAQWGLVDAVAALLGVPLKNIRRDIEGAKSLIQTVGADLTKRDTTLLSLQDEVMNDVLGTIPFFGKKYQKNRQDKLYGAMVAGDEEYVRRLKESYGSNSGYHSAIRQGLRNHDSRIWEAAVAVNQEDLEGYYETVNEILMEQHFEQKDVVLAIQAEAESMKEKTASESESFVGKFNAEKLGIALGQDNGKMVDIISQDLMDTDMANGKTQKEAEDALESDVKSQLKERYLEDGLKKSLAVKQLARYGGMSQEEARSEVDAWDWLKINPDSEATTVQVKGYLGKLPDLGRSISEYGIDMETYLKEKKTIADFPSDKDEEGNSVPYSRINKAFPYINSLPLTAEQKTALAVACGWGLETVEKNKLW